MVALWAAAAVLAAVLPAARPAALNPRPHRQTPADSGGGGEGGNHVFGDVYAYQPLVPYYASTPHPCPQIAPAQVDLDQLLGPWHLSLLLLPDRTPTSDGLDQPLLDDSMCAAVEVARTNASMLRLDWQLRQLGLPSGLADLRLDMAAAVLGQPGLWGLATPLAGEMVGIVSHAAPRSHFVLAVCGEQQQQRRARRRLGGDEDAGVAVHVLTVLLTRRPPSDLGSLELLRLSQLLLPDAGGYRRVDERLLSWGQC